MKFRPCIDIHNGKVKQIVGGSLTDTGDWAQTNFVAERRHSGLLPDTGRTGLRRACDFTESTSLALL